MTPLIGLVSPNNLNQKFSLVLGRLCFVFLTVRDSGYPNQVTRTSIYSFSTVQAKASQRDYRIHEKIVFLRSDLNNQILINCVGSKNTPIRLALRPCLGPKFPFKILRSSLVRHNNVQRPTTWSHSRLFLDLLHSSHVWPSHLTQALAL